MLTTVDEFYKVGPGPSSSRTIGPMRITYGVLTFSTGAFAPGAGMNGWVPMIQTVLAF